MKKATKSKTKSKKTTMEVGAGLIAASAVAAAGYYFYGSKDAKKHRKIAAKWATAMKSEVVKETKRLEKASPRAFAAIVDRVAKTYQGVRSIDIAEVKQAAKELKANWDAVKSEVKRTTRKSVSRAKKQ